MNLQKEFALTMVIDLGGLHLVRELNVVWMKDSGKGAHPP